MRFREDPVIPRVLFTGVGPVLVVKPNIPQDVCACRVSRTNLGAAVKHAVKLIKIHRLRNVRGDKPVVLVSLLHTVNLYGEQHWYAVPIEFPGEGDSLRAAPAMTVN